MIILIMIQIILESIPLSSSGHLTIVQKIIYAGPGNLYLSQSVVWLAHLPTVFLIAWYFRRRWLLFVRFPWKTRNIWMKLCLWGLSAECVTIFLYVIMKRVPLPLWTGFLLSAGLFASTQWCSSTRTIPQWWHYLVLGVAQGAAVLPGVSRLACTYVLGRWCGFSPAQSFDVSWTLAWPLYTGAAIMGFFMIDKPIFSIMPPYVLVMTTLVAGTVFYLVKSMLVRRYDALFSCYLIMISCVTFVLKI
jgi:undecaprenyl-diphosphatase